MKIKLNIGCCVSPKDGYINIDMIDYGQEIIRDITRGLPFNDNSVDEIFTSHTLEHIENKDVPFVWEEMYRVLKPNGIIDIIVPHARENQAFMMNHWSYWEEAVVEVLCNMWGSKDHHTKTDFEILNNEKKGVELYIKLRAR